MMAGRIEAGEIMMTDIGRTFGLAVLCLTLGGAAVRAAQLDGALEDQSSQAGLRFEHSPLRAAAPAAVLAPSGASRGAEPSLAPPRKRGFEGFDNGYLATYRAFTFPARYALTKTQKQVDERGPISKKIVAFAGAMVCNFLMIASAIAGAALGLLGGLVGSAAGSRKQPDTDDYYRDNGLVYFHPNGIQY